MEISGLICMIREIENEDHVLEIKLKPNMTAKINEEIENLETIPIEKNRINIIVMSTDREEFYKFFNRGKRIEKIPFPIKMKIQFFSELNDFYFVGF